MKQAIAALTTAALAGLATTSCSDSSSSPARGRDRAGIEATDELMTSMRAYVDDPGYRRRALEESLVRRDNRYSALRLERYDEVRWGSLPEHLPATAPIVAGEENAPPTPPRADDAAWSSLDVEATGWNEIELRALGERAFFRYPVQAAEAMPRALASADHAGVWKEDGKFGAVWVALPAKVVVAAFTCATCHASRSGDGDSRLIAGRNNEALDAGRIYGDGRRGMLWGLGRVDVTQDGLDNPVAIADLRPVRHQHDLHRAATLRNGPTALAVRIETLLITNMGESARPPRKLVAALTVYLHSLAPSGALPQSSLGSSVFARECASCHRGDSTSGPPISLAAIGTDPNVGLSSERGTGFYRVPSLRAVGDRRGLFASGAIDGIDALLDPERTVAGHRYGLELGSEERAELVGYLRGL